MVRSAGRSWTWVVQLVAFSVLALCCTSQMSAQSSPCGPMDLVFVVDTTGSMQGTLDNITSELSNLITQLDIASGGDFRLGLVQFKDEVIVDNDLATGNTASVAANLRSYSASGGSGEPEASDEALNTVINSLPASSRPTGKQTGDFRGRFRDNAAKIIILTTDARPAGFDDNFTAGEDDVHAHAMTVAANAKGIRISAIYLPTELSLATGSEFIQGIMRDYASGTGGRFIKANADGSGVALAISNIINSCGGATFFIGATPPVVDLLERETAHYDVTTTAIGRFNEPLYFTLVDPPAGSTYSFDPPMVDAPGSGSTVLNFTPGPDMLGGTYRLNVAATTADGRLSRAATVSVVLDCRPPFVYGTTDYQPTSQAVPYGTQATLRVIPGGSSPYSYQWYEGFSSDTLFPIPLATSSTFLTPPVVEKKEYWVRITNSCGSYDSWTAEMTVGTSGSGSVSQHPSRSRTHH